MPSHRPRHASVVIVLLGLILALPAASQTYRYDDAWAAHGLSVTAQDAGGVRLTLSLTSWQLGTEQIDGRSQATVQIPGVMLPNQAGAPNLPGFSRYLAMPDGARARVEVVASRSEVIADVDLAPAPEIPFETEDGPLRFQRNDAIYTTDAYYPASPVRLGEGTEIRGVDAVMLGVTPFQYNPVTRELVVYRDLELSVTFEGGSGQVGQARLRSHWFDPILRDVFANADLLPPAPPVPAAGQRTPDLEYVIITPPATTFVAWADTLARFRNEQGIRTGVVTTDEIGGNTVAAIENYINTAYNTWDVPPVAVLLLGDYGGDDSSIIAPIWDGYCVSDHIYADVNGNDMADVILARMAAANPTHLETFVRKVVDYERQPPTTPGFYANPIIAGGWQTERWFILCDEVLLGFMANELGKTPVREYAIYEGTPGSVWSTATNTSTVVNYFGPNGLGYIPATPGHLNDWGGNATRINAALESGAFILQHRDHGDVQGWGEPDYDNADVAALNNQDLSFIFSMNCLTGKYNASQECFAEAFHRSTTGALGVIAASEISYSFVNDAYTWGLYDNMWPSFDPGYGAPGAHRMLPAFGNAAGKYYLQASNWPYNTDNKEVTYYLFHHHGDAFSTVFTEMPEHLTVAHDDALLSGVDFFTVSADEGALIGLSVGGQLIATAVAGAGQTVVPIVPQLPGQDLLVTVTLQNHYRYEQPVPIIPPEGPWVIHAGHALNDLEGNANGQLDFGESSLLSLTLHNVGLEASTGVTAVLSTDDPYLTIDDATGAVADIPADGYATATDAYHVSLATDVPDGHPMRVLVTVTDAAGSYESSFVLTAHAPVLEVPQYVITGDGDADGILDPGETADLTVTLANTGTALVSGLAMTLAVDHPLVTVNVGAASLPDLGAGQSADLVFNVTASADAPIGTPVSFLLDVTATDFAYQADLGMVIGLQIEDFESGSFLVFPWEMGGNGPWTMTTTSPFEGAYSARSGTITHNQGSTLSLEASVLAPGTITFHYKVDSESSYDFLRFAIDGTELGSWSGNIGWTEATFPVSPGVHVFEWSYTKDGSVSDGQDCGWVDHIVFPAVSEPPRPACEVTPESLASTVVKPDSGTATLTVANSGEGELQYTIAVALDVQPQTDIPVLTQKKDQRDPREGAAPTRGAGGPDPFGYTWIDSDEAGGPVYQWQEINAIGTAVAAGDDSNLGPFPLGFTFPFYGVEHDQVRICSNGWVSFTSTSTAYSNQGIPSSGDPNNLLALLWDDLNPASGGQIYYHQDTANQRFIVEWDGVPHYGSGGGPETFQVILSADGSILYQYKTVANGTSATVGIEDATGATGLQVSFNSSYLHDQLAILLASEPLPVPWMSLESYAGTVAPGAQAEVTVNFNTIDAEYGDHHGTLTVHTNDLENPQVVVPVTLTVADDITAAPDALPTAYALHAASPNPFNPATTLRYAVPRSGRVQLRIYDVAGHRVRTLVEGRQPAGYHEVMWDGRDHAGRGVASGTYYYRLDAEGYTATRKMTLVK